MKNIILTVVLFLALTLNAQAQLAGTINVGDGETYETLKEAFDALMQDGISGDVTFLITSDLTETQNVFLGFDARPHTVTIRPAAGETPTITFSQATANSSINGALVIGATADDWDNLVTTANIVIDGSNNGTDSRDMSFTTTTSANTSNYFRLVGRVENVTWKNTNVNVQQQSFDTILISPLRRNDTDFVPTNLVIENNQIVSQPGRTSSRAINVWGVTGSGFETVESASEISILNNEIFARRYGIWLRSMTGNTTIQGNTIEIQEPGTLQAYGLLVQQLFSDAVLINILENTFTSSNAAGALSVLSAESAANYTIQGNTFSNIEADGQLNIIDLLAHGNYNVNGNNFNNFIANSGMDVISVSSDITENNFVSLSNNMITGFGSASTSGQALYGIVLRSPVFPAVLNVEMFHNSIVLNPISVTGTGWNYRGLFVFSNPRILIDMKNNIFINDDNNGSGVLSYAYYQAGSATAGFDSDFNLWHVSNPSAASTWLSRHGAVGTNTTTLAGHQANTDGDPNSVSKAVTFVNAAAGNLRLTGDSDGDADLAGTPLAEVTTDIDGTPRDLFRPYMGAFEGTKLSPFVTVTGDAGWRMMSAPVSGMDVAFLATQTAIQGVDGAEFGTDFAPNIYTAFDGTDWIAPAGFATPLTSGTGFILYFYDNDQAGSSPLPVTVAANGSSTPDTDVTVPVHNNGSRHNLLGNPFNAALDISAITANGTISAVAQVWVDGVGVEDEGSWVATSSAPFNGVVAPWQGFVIENTDATEVTIPTGALSGDDATFQNYNPANERYLSFTLTGTDRNDGLTVSDRAAALIMNEDATTGWDRYDLHKLGSLAPRSSLIYFVGENEQGWVPKALESHPFELDETLELPLGFVSYGVSGDFELSWPEMRNFPPYFTITLTDLETGAVVDLMQSNSYSFTHLDETKGEFESARFRVPELTSGTEHRFLLTIANQTTSNEVIAELPAEVFLAQNYPNPFNPTTTIRFELPEQQKVTLLVYDILGRQVAQLVNEVRAAGTHSISFDASRLSSGVYLYRLEAGNTSFTRRMMLVK